MKMKHGIEIYRCEAARMVDVPVIENPSQPRTDLINARENDVLLGHYYFHVLHFTEIMLAQILPSRCSSLGDSNTLVKSYVL